MDSTGSEEIPDDPKFRDLTWGYAQQLGIPSSPIRDALFVIADCLDAKPRGDLLALATAAYRAVERELAEHYRPRSPLEIQVETIRAERELAQMLKTEFPRVEFKASDFDPIPESPEDLGRSLGYRDGGRAVRHLLRRGFPDHEPHTRWSPLTEAQINYVKAHLVARSVATPWQHNS